MLFGLPLLSFNQEISFSQWLPDFHFRQLPPFSGETWSTTLLQEVPPPPGAKRRKGTPGSGTWASQPPKHPRNHGGYWGSPHKTMEWGCFRWDQGTGYLWLPTSQHEADAAESSGYMLFVNENFSRVRAELSQAAEEEEESVASVAAAQTTQPSFSSIAKESRGNSGSWNQTFGENMVGKLCMTCCSECWICWPLEIPVGTQIDFILRSLVCRTC